ncbi:Basic leucine zipper 23 [Bienertia sinuspersici]
MKRVRKEGRDNKDAVRRYYKKLKLREAELEDEVKKLRVLNQELMKRLEGEAAMQDEVTLLKCLLVDIRGRIEGEICSFRHYKPPNSTCFNARNSSIDHVSSGDQNEELNTTHQV